MARIVITGASGTGTTTLGRAVADRLGAPAFDADEAFWIPTDPPFMTKRPADERDQYIRARLEDSDNWVLSGSVASWPWPRPGADIDLAVFLAVPQEIRLARLLAREVGRHGEAALAPGGVMHEIHAEFLAWAARYETAGLEQRSRTTHEAWLLSCHCPVLRIEGDTTVAERIGLVEDALRGIPRGARGKSERGGTPGGR